MPTLYDNFSQVKQYIDQQTAGGSSTDITKDIIPAATDTYTLGDASHLYKSTYINNTYTSNVILSDTYNWIKNASNTQIDFGVNQYNRVKLTNERFCPSTNNGVHLGGASNQWNRTYTAHLYINGTDVEEMFPTYTAVNGMFSYDSATGTLTITTL